jgi:hypothetical protein
MVTTTKINLCSSLCGGHQVFFFLPDKRLNLYIFPLLSRKKYSPNRSLTFNIRPFYLQQTKKGKENCKYFPYESVRRHKAGPRVAIPTFSPTTQDPMPLLPPVSCNPQENGIAAAAIDHFRVTLMVKPSSIIFS